MRKHPRIPPPNLSPQILSRPTAFMLCVSLFSGTTLLLASLIYAFVKGLPHE